MGSRRIDAGVALIIYRPRTVLRDDFLDGRVMSGHEDVRDALRLAQGGKHILEEGASQSVSRNAGTDEP